MSLGAFMAAEEMSVDSLYVNGRFDRPLIKLDMRTAQITAVSRPANGAPCPYPTPSTRISLTLASAESCVISAQARVAMAVATWMASGRRKR